MDLNSEQASWEFLDWTTDEGVEIAKPAVGQAMNQQQQRRQQMPQLACPRCDSTNTKFCYYNNYSRSQPRHFCKACRRHWTKGGKLRSVPVGGGRRKKRPKTANSPATTADVSSNSGSISSSYPMQQQLVLPFDVDSNEICSISDDPHQVLLCPTPPPHRPSEYGASTVDLNQSLPPFSPRFVGTGPITMNSCEDIIRPFFTPSSSYHDYMGPHPVTTTENFAMPGGLTSASTWREPAASGGGMGSSPGYWAGWDDDIALLVDPELEPSSADEGPQRPWKNKEMAGVLFRV